jgi:predicted dehydrogenase
MNDIRFGFVGAGTVAHQMAADLALVDGASLVAVATRSRQSASRLATLHQARVLDSFDQLVGDPSIDVVYLATPPQLHAAQAIGAMRAGKGVLIEKPFSLNATDARSIAAAAFETGQFCMEAMWSRFIPSITELRARIASGALGEVRSFESDFSYAHVPNPNHHAFQLPGGGALLDRGVYGVSLACDLFGPPLEVLSRATIGQSGVDEDVLVVLTHQGGVRSTITASLRVRGSNQASVKGTAATVLLGDPYFATDRLTMLPAGATTSIGAVPASAPGPLIERIRANPKGLRLFETAKGIAKAGFREVGTEHMMKRGNGYAHQIEAVVAALRAGKIEVDAMTPAQSVTVMEILDTAREQWLVQSAVVS